MAAKELFITSLAGSKAVGDPEREPHVQLCEKTIPRVESATFGPMFALRASVVLKSLQNLELLARSPAAARIRRKQQRIGSTPC